MWGFASLYGIAKSIGRKPFALQSVIDFTKTAGPPWFYFLPELQTLFPNMLKKHDIFVSWKLFA